MKEKIKELRLRIDGLSQLEETLYGSQLYLLDIENKPKGMSIQDYTKSYTEMYKCYDSLILAKAWLGKMLGELGEATPYVNDGNRKTVADIEPAADKTTNTRNSVGCAIFIDKSTGNPITTDTEIWNNKTHIEKVDWLRQEIEEIVVEIRFLGDLNLSGTTYSNTFINNVTTHLSEARFWLGFVLQRIKEQK